MRKMRGTMEELGGKPGRAGMSDKWLEVVD
jgi:hypothetical protein